MRVMVVVQSQTNLLQIVLALRPASRLTSLLNSRQQQRHQNGNDRDHHQQLNQRKTSAPTILPASPQT